VITKIEEKSATETCALCGIEFSRPFVVKLRRRSTRAMVGTLGPYCQLCYYVQLALKCADVRRQQGLPGGFGAPKKKLHETACLLYGCAKGFKQKNSIG